MEKLKKYKMIILISIIISAIIIFILTKISLAENIPATGTERDIDGEKTLIKMTGMLSMGTESSGRIAKTSLENGLNKYLGTGKTTVSDIAERNAISIKYNDSGREYEIDKETAQVDVQTTLTFDPNGGSVSPTSKKVVYNKKYGSLPTPTKPGFTFLGWYTAASGGDKKTSESIYQIDGPSTLYAQWRANTVTLTNMVGGQQIENFNSWNDMMKGEDTVEIKTFSTTPGHRYYVLSEWSGFIYYYNDDPLRYVAKINIGAQSYTFKDVTTEFLGDTKKYSTIYTATSTSTVVSKYFYRNNSQQGSNTTRLKMFVDLTELESARGSQIDTDTFESLYGEFYNNKVVNPTP